MVTVLPASAVPVNVGVVSVVTLSVWEQPLSLASVRSGADGAAGAVLSSVKLTALPAKKLPDLSVAVACTAYVPSLCDAHVGRVALSVHVTAVLLVVAPWIVGRLATPACQADPVQ